MGIILLIVAFIVYYAVMEHAKNKAVDNYDISKVDTLKMTLDMDKPLWVREQKLIRGEYDIKKK